MHAYRSYVKIECQCLCRNIHFTLFTKIIVNSSPDALRFNNIYPMKALNSQKPKRPSLQKNKNTDWQVTSVNS